MGFRDWLQNKREKAEKISEQARAELLRKQNSKTVKEGSMRHSYMIGMNPIEFGKHKMMEYRQKK